MGGKMTLLSTPGAGSSFCFSLEIAAAPEPSRAAEGPDSAFFGGHESGADAGATPLTVLLVEDNPVNQMFCEALLKQAGHNVDIAADGLEATRLAAERSYDLILMDCHMPVLDGFEATRRIHRADAKRGIERRPIVALTATAMAEDRQRCLDAGMDDVLTKPFTREDFARLLARVASHALG
jgi:CheY-like chemotaxis protein